MKAPLELEQLQKSEAKLRQVIDAIPALVWCNLPEGPNEFLNKGWHEYTGLSPEESHGWGWQAAFHPDDQPPLMERWRELLVSGEPGEIEARLRRHDGAYRWFLIRVEPFRDDAGKIVRWYGTSTDIDDRKRAVEALQASERELRSIISTIPTLAWSAGPDGSADFLNQRWLDYTGMSAEQAQGWGWGAAIHPDDVNGLVECWQSSLASGTPLEAEARMRRYDGAYRWFLFRANPSRDEAGNISKWYGTNIDIEDRKRGEEALRASELSWRQIVDNIPGFVVTMTAGGEVEFLNRQILEYFGKTNEELKSWALIDAVHRDDLPRVIEVRTKSLQTGQIYDVEHRCRRADGVYRWFQVRGLPVRNAEGTVTAWYLLLTDIDDRKRADERLQAAMSERTRLLALRADIATALASRDTLKGILHKCADALVRHFDAAFARIWTLRNDCSELELQASAGIYTRLDGRYSRIPVGDIKMGLIAKERQAHLTNDVQNDPRIRDHNWARAEKIQSFAGFPLVLEDRVVGVIAVFSRHALTESTLETLALIADGIGQGIERKRGEDALRSSERNLSIMIDAIRTLILVLRPDGSLLDVNRAVMDYWGVTLEDLQKGDYRDRLFHPEDVKRLREERRDALTRGVPFENEQRSLGKDGTYRWFLVRYNPLLDEQGGIDRWYVAAFDIEDRKRAEAEVKQAYLHLTEAQGLSKTGSFISDFLVDEHNWSEEARRIFELEPAAKVTAELVRDRIHPEDLPTIDAVMARGMTGTDVDFLFRIVTYRGAVKHVRGFLHLIEQVAGRPLFCGALQDVTESKVAEEALNRARSELAYMSRVTTLNALTASIAHEINQPLSGIITNASTCLRMLDGDPPNLEGARETARRTIRDGNRAADVITRLRALFSKKDFTLESLDLNEATREVIALSLSDFQRDRIILRSELAYDLPPVTGDRIQLQQVILNLLRNASDAMIGVEDRARYLLITTLRDGDDHVRLSVQDNGTGLNPQDLARLFEAFYTTKSGGMGIGLSVSRSIIERHHGSPMG